MGPGDRPAPGEGPGWDIPPDVSEGVDIYQTAGSDPTHSFRGKKEHDRILILHEQYKFNTTINH